MTGKKLTRSGLFLVVFICASVVVAYLLKSKGAEDSTLQPLAELNQANVTSLNTPDVAPPSLEREIKEVQKADAQWRELQSLPNDKLMAAVKAFWRTCRARNDCDSQLQLLQQAVSVDRYTIISDYPENLSLFNEMLSYELTSQDWALEQKVDEVKSAYANVWGALSEELFFEELAFYDQRLALHSLYRDSQDLTLEGKLQVFDHWVQGQPDNGSKLNPYDAAKLFLGQELDAHKDKTLALKLAEKYLPADQVAQEKQRFDRREFQAGQAQDYQKALSALRQTLMAERKGVYRDLSEADWLEHREVELRKFKVQFFE